MMAGAFMTTVLADSYNIWVGDVQVTDANKNDISPSSKTAGTRISRIFFIIINII